MKETIICFVLFIFFLFVSGCVSTAKYKELQVGYSKLQVKHKNLQSEYEELKKTPKYYYQKGLEFQKTNEFKSYDFLKTLCKKFPNDQLAADAHKKMREIEKNNYAKITGDLATQSGLKEKITSLKAHILSYENYISKKGIQLLQNRLAQLERKEALGKYVSVKDDPMQECKFIKTKRNIKYKLRKYSRDYYSISIYAVHRYSGTKNLRLETEYYGEGWVFYKRITLLGNNGAKLVVDAGYPEKKSNVVWRGKVREWSDEYIDSEKEKIIFKLAKANKISVRFDGKYSKTFDMTEEQLKGFKEIVAKYKRL